MAPSRLVLASEVPQTPNDTDEAADLPPLEAYAAQIMGAAKAIGKYCERSGIPHPSFDPNAPSTQLPHGTPEDILKARSTIQSASIKLQQLSIEPEDFIPNLSIPYQALACVRWLCRFKIMFSVPISGSAPYSTVAKLANVPEAQLKSVARMAMLQNFFCEAVPGHISQTAITRRFVENPSLVEWVLYLAEIGSPSSTKFVEATEKWGDTTDKTQTAVSLFFNTDMAMFDYVASSPELTRMFAGYMKNATQSSGNRPQHLVNGFDWSALGNGTVVDVGGSNCHITIALAESFADLNFIVQDLPTTITNASSILQRQPLSIATRVSTQGYNFFDPQPILGADVYLFRTIFHDWPDHDAIMILRNQIPALSSKPKSRLLIMDIVLPEPGSVDIHEESLLRVQDLKMIQTYNAYERGLVDWTRLLQEASKADPELGNNAQRGAFVLKSMKKPFGSFLSILEIVYEI